MRAVVKDTFGDALIVQDLDGRVWVDVRYDREESPRARLALTPKKARRLAKALKRAAKEIPA